MNITNEILENLRAIEQEHDVTIICAVESGSRAWGFPSPDSDYDVRFIYAHPPEWYIQLAPARDVIEVPINEVLDISGWDLRKALTLANTGNTVVHEWLASPLVYQQHTVAFRTLQQQVAGTFKAVAGYHHYISMAKRMFAEIDEQEAVKLKRFFYFSRAVLSAEWIVRNQTMPSIEFDVLMDGLSLEPDVRAGFDTLVALKADKDETETGVIPAVCMDDIREMYWALTGKASIALNAKQQLVGNQDFRGLLGSL